MKNIIFIICLAIASLFLSSCKKDLMKDKNVLEMFSELDKIDFKNDSSLLCFKSNEDFEKVTSILETYVQKGTEKDYDIDDPILYAFEEKYNKNSLRRMIVKETELLESKDSLFENNDPDDRYVGDDIIRKRSEHRFDPFVAFHGDGFPVALFFNITLFRVKGKIKKRNRDK